jgi:hypothetical protein
MCGSGRSPQLSLTRFWFLVSRTGRTPQLSRYKRIAPVPTAYVGFRIEKPARMSTNRGSYAHQGSDPWRGMLTRMGRKQPTATLQGARSVCIREADLGSPDLAPAVLSTRDHRGNSCALPRSCPHSKGAAWEKE